MSKLCRLILLAATGFFTYGLVQLGIHFPPGVCLVAAGAAWRRLNGRRNSGSHGTATAATSADLAGGGLLAEGEPKPDPGHDRIHAAAGTLAGGACPALAPRRLGPGLSTVPVGMVRHRLGQGQSDPHRPLRSSHDGGPDPTRQGPQPACP